MDADPVSSILLATQFKNHGTPKGNTIQKCEPTRIVEYSSHISGCAGGRVAYTSANVAATMLAEGTRCQNSNERGIRRVSPASTSRPVWRSHVPLPRRGKVFLLIPSPCVGS
jgi:hypothetical protein